MNKSTSEDELKIGNGVQERRVEPWPAYDRERERLIRFGKKELKKKIREWRGK